MARDEDLQFRITAWPPVLTAPEALAVPEFVGYALPGKKEPRRTSGEPTLGRGPLVTVPLVTVPMLPDDPDVLTGVKRFAEVMEIDGAMTMVEIEAALR